MNRTNTISVFETNHVNQLRIRAKISGLTVGNIVMALNQQFLHYTKSHTLHCIMARVEYFFKGKCKMKQLIILSRTVL